MSIIDSATNVIGKVSPFADAFFVIVIAFLGLIAWRKGEREAVKVRGEELSMPTYLMAHDAARAVKNIADAAKKLVELQEKTNAILQDIAKSAVRIDMGQVHTHRLLNSLRNEQQMRGTMAHPEKAVNEEDI